MRYVLVIAPRPFDIKDLGGIAPGIEAVLTSPDGDFLLQGTAPDQNIRLEPSGSDHSDWADYPRKVAMIEAVGPCPEIYAVHFQSVERLKTVLRGLVRPDSFIVDDDYDLFVTGDEFIRLDDAKPRSNCWWLGAHYR